MRTKPAVIRHYLTPIVYPACLTYRGSKLFATSEDLGGGSIFSTLIGFSGTPTRLLPYYLGQCEWEEGTEGQFGGSVPAHACLTCVSYKGSLTLPSPSPFRYGTLLSTSKFTLSLATTTG